MKRGTLLFCFCLVIGLVIMSTGCDKLKELTSEKAAEVKSSSVETVEPAPLNPSE